MMRRNIFFSGLLVLAVFVSGCVSQGLLRASLDIPFQLKVGQTAAIEPESLKITFRNVTQDSRCPSGVQCVWRGVALVELEVFKGEQPLGKFGLSDYDTGNYTSEVTVSGYAIKLENIKPYPKSEVPIKPEEYVATIKVSKK